MIPIAICDDELLHARQTQAVIRRCEAQAVTRCFETPLALLAAVVLELALGAMVLYGGRRAETWLKEHRMFAAKRLQ